MAQIINKGPITNGDSLKETFMNDLRSLFSGSSYDAQNYKLYITNSTYIQFFTAYSTSVTLKFGNSKGVDANMAFSNASSVYYQMIKTASGDVAVRMHTSQLTDDNMHFQFAIIGLKYGDTNSHGFFVPTNTPPGANAFIVGSTNAGYTSIIADDTTKIGVASTYASASSTVSQVSPINCGQNPEVFEPKLIPAFGTYSKYVSDTAKIMLITPRPYNGDCVINGKRYYCISFFAMLDESGA